MLRLLPCLSLVAGLVLSAVGYGAERFPFVIPGDDALKGTATDMSGLSPAAAGTDGFVRVRDGRFFTDSGRFRVWGVNLCFAANFPDKADAPKIAAHMAKLGVNCVRIHHHDTQSAPSGIWARELRDGVRVFDPDMIDRLDFFLAELHKHGIYVNLNLHCGRELTPAEGFPSYNVSWVTSHNKYCTYFDPRIRRVLKEFCRNYLTHVNPYRKLRRVDDPGVAFLELTNENYFSKQGPGVADKLPKPYRGEFKRQWNAWLQKKYGSDYALANGWGSASEPESEVLVQSAGWDEVLGKWQAHGHDDAPMIATAGQPGPKPEIAAIRLDLQGVADKAWKQQVMMNDVTIEGGKLYTFRCWYKAEKARPISFDVATPWPQPWKDRGLVEQLQATTDWQYYERTFEGVGDGDNPARLCFNLGEHDGDVWLAGVSLVRGGTQLVIPPGQSLTAGTIEIPVDGKWVKTAVADAVSFMKEVEVAFVQDMLAYLKDELGAKVPISSTQVNYHMPSVAVRTGSEFFDLHAYWQHPLFPGRMWDENNWYVRHELLEAHPFHNTWPRCSVLARAGWRLHDYPFTLSEWNSGEPMRYGASQVAIAAIVARLQDWDGVYFFQYDSESDRPFRNYFDNYFSMNGQPAKLATFTAFANLFRRGDLAPIKAEIATPLDAELPHGALGLQARVGMRAGAAPLDLGAYSLDPVMTSPDKSVNWRAAPAESAHLTVNTPLTRAALGRVGGGKFELDGVRFEVGDAANDYAVIVLTSLDNKPIAESRRMLLAAIGTAENTGMKWTDDGNSVGRNWGHGPNTMNGIPLAVTIPGPPVTVYALDGAGNRLRTADPRALGPAYATIWYEFER